MTQAIEQPQQEKRRRAYIRGSWAEHLAAWALRLKGFAILRRRYRTPAGEIDLIARKGRLIVFCEVKYRKHPEDALEAVTERQRARIARAAEYFCIRTLKSTEYRARFDVMAVTPWQWPEHYPNAWQEE